MKKVKISLFITILLFVIFYNSAHTQEEQYMPEDKRARLNEARECFRENPGTSWKECRYSCAEVCSQVLETYARGVCHGVLIQLCCDQYPGKCR